MTPMAKQGQHENSANDRTESKGPNNPSQSQPIITGTSKKRETYAAQARARKDPGVRPQLARNDWNEDTRDQPSIEGSTRARHPRSGRSGSDSNADSGSRGH
jgi:hypothetical protein